MKKQSLSVLEYGGFRTDAWAIACYASVDDLAVSSSNVLSVGTSIDQSQYDNVTSDMPHNLYLTITPKNNFTEDAKQRSDGSQILPETVQVSSA